MPTLPYIYIHAQTYYYLRIHMYTYVFTPMHQTIQKDTEMALQQKT